MLAHDASDYLMEVRQSAVTAQIQVVSPTTGVWTLVLYILELELF